MQLDPHMLIAERRTKDLIVDVNMLCSAAEVSAPGTCNFFCAAAPQYKSKSQARYAVSDAWSKEYQLRSRWPCIIWECGSTTLTTAVYIIQNNDDSIILSAEGCLSSSYMQIIWFEDAMLVAHKLVSQMGDRDLNWTTSEPHSQLYWKW